MCEIDEMRIVRTKDYGFASLSVSEVKAENMVDEEVCLDRARQDRFRRGPLIRQPYVGNEPEDGKV